MPREKSIDEQLSSAQAVHDLAAALISAAGEVMKLHGNDSDSDAIVAAAFCSAIEQIEQKIDPTFKARVVTQLLGEEPQPKPRI